MMTLPELEKIREAITCARPPSVYRQLAVMGEALEIITREIDHMKQDELLSESKANPT